MPDPRPEPRSGPEVADRRHKLARKWAYLVSLAAYLPYSQDEIERELLDLVNRLFDAITSEPMPTDRVNAVGARLVELNCIGKASLQCTMDALGGALHTDPDLQRFDRLPERVTRLLGAMVAGYAEALQLFTMAQQDNLHRALLEAMWRSERMRRSSESRLDEVVARSTSGIAITDLDGRFVKANAACDRLLDRTSPKATLFDLVAAHGDVDPRAAYQKLRDGTLERLALRARLPAAGTQVSLVASLLRDPDGMATDYVTIVDADRDPPGLAAGHHRTT